MAKQCPCCPNRSDQGLFEGDYCMPCARKKSKYPMVDTLFGRSFEHWHDVDNVMARYGIETAPQLRNKLQLLTEKPESRIEVYDAVNRDRLLGTIPKPSMQGRFVQMAVLPRMAVCDFRAVSYDEIAEVTYTKVTMEADIKRGPNPLDVKGVLTTHDKLNDLLKLRDFRLPGESEHQAEQRRYYS
jgi:hypothetical protein